jgi:serine/threonine protein kinase
VISPPPFGTPSQTLIAPGPRLPPERTWGGTPNLALCTRVSSCPSSVAVCMGGMLMRDSSGRFLHKLGYVHCDIKLDNCVLTAPPSGRSAHAKLIDYGSVRKLRGARKNTAMVQTRSHRAPEVSPPVVCMGFGWVSSDCVSPGEVHLGSGWGMEIDVWSVGCIAVELYIGCNLFAGCHSNPTSV